MYSKRIKIFVIISGFLLLICLARLVQMQVLSSSYSREKVAELKRQRGLAKSLKTVRGKILDRNGEVLAEDSPQFQLYISYSLTSIADERIQKSLILKALGKADGGVSVAEAKEEIHSRLEDLQLIINKCVQLGGEQESIEDKINYINRRVWNLRSFLAWRRNNPDARILKKYGNVNSIPLSVAMADFKKRFGDADHRINLAADVTDIAEMEKDWAFLELKTDDDIFAAQVEFMDVDGVAIRPSIHRYYPHGSYAAQTIGWVGPASDDRQGLFSDDRFTKYIAGDISGKEDGAEFICETLLRGRRGEVVYDIDRKLANRTDIEVGNNVSLTIDIKLQRRIAKYISNCKLNNYCQAPMGTIVIDVESGDILSMVSLPSFDLNKVRYTYGELVSDKNEPLRNRVINKAYPPGSSTKPLILVAGMEAGQLVRDGTISCPAERAGKGWPNCWYYKQFNMGHDEAWTNTGRNAIRGSCNVFFSRLASRVEPLILQEWLFKFGYGHNVVLAPEAILQAGVNRDFRQTQGQISNVPVRRTITSFDEIPPLKKSERRWFGMGQGSLMVTPFQIANAMATIARNGMYKKPRLFIEENSSVDTNSIDIGISSETLAVVLDGMHAVVSESGGTAYRQFRQVDFEKHGVTVYGKTGSTEGVEVAWFAGFAKDSKGRAIAVAVLVEGGQHGSTDASPLARSIIEFCIDAGYIGEKL
ncbi:MAG: hypothetical protein FVQ80_04000 [Planctomycetes bacterium]|nr:hypothetical protein [Planctomycetota bacterium]